MAGNKIPAESYRQPPKEGEGISSEMSHFSEYKVHNQILLYSLVPFLNKAGLEADLSEFSLESEQNHERCFEITVCGSSRATTDCRDENLTADLCKGKRVEKENHNLLCRGLQISEINQAWPSCGIFA